MCCDDFLLQFPADFKSYIVMICQKKKSQNNNIDDFYKFPEDL